MILACAGACRGGGATGECSGEIVGLFGSDNRLCFTRTETRSATSLEQRYDIDDGCDGTLDDCQRMRYERVGDLVVQTRWVPCDSPDPDITCHFFELDEDGRPRSELVDVNCNGNPADLCWTYEYDAWGRITLAEQRCAGHSERCTTYTWESPTRVHVATDDCAGVCQAVSIQILGSSDNVVRVEELGCDEQVGVTTTYAGSCGIPVEPFLLP